MVSKITELTIFESPDGGRTVYVRKPGEEKRKLYSQNGIQGEELDDYGRWIAIYNARRANPVLNDLCSQAEVIYELTQSSE